MEYVASHGYCHPQQFLKLHHWFHLERIVDRMGTPTIGTTMNGIQELHSRGIPLKHPEELTSSNPCS
jgi:hypothetical protein